MSDGAKLDPQLLKEWRLSQRLTQAQAALRFSVSRGTYRKWELGEWEPMDLNLYSLRQLVPEVFK